MLRTWKGYRNARCAFVEAASPDVGPNKRQQSKALFLVIFAPKRGLLEVWSMQSGPRVGAFNVDPRGRLLSVPSLKESLLLGSAEVQLPSAHSCVTAVFINSNGTIAVSLSAPMPCSFSFRS